RGAAGRAGPDRAADHLAGTRRRGRGRGLRRRRADQGVAGDQRAGRGPGGPGPPRRLRPRLRAGPLRPERGPGRGLRRLVHRPPAGGCTTGSYDGGVTEEAGESAPDADNEAPAGPQGLARWRWTITAAFGLGGITVSAWGPRLPAIKASLGIGTATIGLLLAGVTIGAILGLLVSTPVLHRLGGRRAVTGALL